MQPAAPSNLADAEALHAALVRRIQAAEQAAGAAAAACPGPWQDAAPAYASSGHVLVDARGAVVSQAAPVALEHLVGWAPLRVLALCAADLRVLARHRPVECVTVRCRPGGGCDPEADCSCGERTWPCPEVADLVARWPDPGGGS